MRRLLFVTFTVCQLAGASQAAATCASPQQMKALQAAALEQQLAAAAQSCHFAADYSLFVAKYRGAILRSDRTVNAFFGSRANSEGYDVYKTRIAQDTSLRSLHDPLFCRSFKSVFDMALGRAGAGKSPAMVQTGYEHCKMPAPLRTVVMTTTMPAARALALADAPVIPTPRMARALVSVPKPVPVGVLASRAPAHVVETPPAQTQTELPETVQLSTTTAEQPRWGRAVADTRPHTEFNDAYEGKDNVPNAYRPGSVWVGAEARDDLPPEHQRPLVMGPDGRWYVLIGHQKVWSRD
jgi:hypothetical protein